MIAFYFLLVGAFLIMGFLYQVVIASYHFDFSQAFCWLLFVIIIYLFLSIGNKHE